MSSTLIFIELENNENEMEQPKDNNFEEDKYYVLLNKNKKENMTHQLQFEKVDKSRENVNK